MAALSSRSLLARQCLVLVATLLLVTFPLRGGASGSAKGFDNPEPGRGSLPEFVEHPQTVIARLGTTVSFSCRARPPSALLSWTADGSVVGNGTELPIGKVAVEFVSDAHGSRTALQVHDVADAPATSFRCLASAPGRPGVVASKGATLVKARLRAFRKAESSVVSAPAGNTVSIKCLLPHSVPPAIGIFEKNGTTIDESKGRYHLLPNGELQITHVQPSDSGIYRCVAINEVTMQKLESSSIVKLNVFDPVNGEPPVMVNYTSKVSVVEGGQILLPCGAIGSPPPTVTWEKFGGDLRPNDRVQRWLGNLRMLKAEESDSGTYLCRAENVHAKSSPATALTMLDVTLLPRIVRPPIEQVCEEGASAAFRCVLRPGLDAATTITWLHDGRPIGGLVSSGSGLLVEMGMDGGRLSSTMTIGSVKVRHQGVYQCLANNSAGEETAYALLQVHEAAAWRKQAPWRQDEERAETGRHPASSTGTQQAAEGGLVMTISRPNVTQSSASGATLFWSVGGSWNESGFVSVETKNRSESSAEWHTVLSGMPRNVAKVKLSGLNPGTLYRFRIVIDLSNGQVLRSPPSAGFRLKLNKWYTEESLTQTPGDIATENSGMRKMATSSIPKRVRTSVAAPARSPADAGVIMPPPKPSVRQVSETGVMVQWTQAFQGMPIAFYRIQYKDTDAGRGWSSQWVTADHDVKPPATQYELPGLRPGGAYKFRLAAVYANRDNRVSEATERVQLVSSSARADAGGGRRQPPQLVPRLTQLLSQAAGQMFLSWEYHTDPSPIDGFVVQYMPVESRSQSGPRIWLESRVPGFNSRTWELRGLLANTSYQVCVKSENAAGRSPCSNALMRATKAETAGDGFGDGFGDMFGLFSQTQRGPLPAGSSNKSQVASERTNGKGEMPDNDEHYQPATRNRTNQQPDELLYLVVGVVAGAMLLTLVVFIVVCVRRQIVQKQCRANVSGDKDGSGSKAGASSAAMRSFGDVSRLIFDDMMHERSKLPDAQQQQSPPWGCVSPQPDRSMDSSIALLDKHPSCEAKVVKLASSNNCSLPETPLKCWHKVDELQNEVCRCEKSCCSPADQYVGPISAKQSLPERLSLYGCGTAHTAETEALTADIDQTQASTRDIAETDTLNRDGAGMEALTQDLARMITPGDEPGYEDPQLPQDTVDCASSLVEVAASSGACVRRPCLSESLSLPGGESGPALTKDSHSLDPSLLSCDCALPTTAVVRGCIVPPGESQPCGDHHTGSNKSLIYDSIRCLDNHHFSKQESAEARPFG